MEDYDTINAKEFLSLLSQQEKDERSGNNRLKCLEICTKIVLFF